MVINTGQGYLKDNEPVKDGYGFLIYKNDDKYNGYFSNTKQGKGRLTLNNGIYI